MQKATPMTYIIYGGMVVRPPRPVLTGMGLKQYRPMQMARNVWRQNVRNGRYIVFLIVKDSVAIENLSRTGCIDKIVLHKY